MEVEEEVVVEQTSSDSAHCGEVSVSGAESLGGREM